MHLSALIDSIHAVQSDRIAPYLAHNRLEICMHCAFLHSSICPCPMDYLTVLLVEAVEAVDQRHRQREKGRQFVAGLLEEHKVGIEEICRAYEEGVGTWAGCDWPTRFGASELDLNRCSAAEAESMAVEAIDSPTADEWSAAARWLARIEEFARQAEEHAAAALEAAAVGQWEKSLQQAQRAWVRELSTGRPLWKKETAWKNLLLAIQKSHLSQQHTLYTAAQRTVL